MKIPEKFWLNCTPNEAIKIYDIIGCTDSHTIQDVFLNKTKNIKQAFRFRKDFWAKAKLNWYKENMPDYVQIDYSFFKTKYIWI